MNSINEQSASGKLTGMDVLAATSPMPPHAAEEVGNRRRQIEGRPRSAPGHQQEEFPCGRKEDRRSIGLHQQRHLCRLDPRIHREKSDAFQIHLVRDGLVVQWDRLDGQHSLPFPGIFHVLQQFDVHIETDGGFPTFLRLKNGSAST
jgi:hypothetical protein